MIMKNRFEKIILPGLSIFMINPTIASASQCGKNNNENTYYEVSMRYVDYHELNSDDLPPREKFNLNKKNPEDQALEYQYGNTDTIITIERKFDALNSEGYLEEHTEKSEILDDTGLYTAHFLVQDLMAKANENREINPEEHEYQIDRIKEQLYKLKNLVNEVATLGKIGIDAENVEDSIGDELGEGDGVLDILDKNPINTIELAKHWTVLMNNISSAEDINIQAYKLDEYSGHWDPLQVPERAWEQITPDNILSIYSVRSAHTNIVGSYTSAANLAIQELKQSWQKNEYYVHDHAKNEPLDVLIYPNHCTTVNPRISGQPRGFLGRIIHSIFEKHKKEERENSQGGQSVQ